MTQPFEAHLSAFLQNANSTDTTSREQAEAGLRQLQENDWPAFIHGLAQNISNESSPEVSRQMAGLLLKNALGARDGRVQAQNEQQWKTLDEARKSQIRAALLTTLSSPVGAAAHASAMAVAKVAKIDLLADQWPDLLPQIHQLVALESPEHTRVYALECLGFVCEEHVEVADRFPQQETNRMLTSLVQGMVSTQPMAVRLASTKALNDALEFASVNFDKTEERNYLMRTICEVMICYDPRVRLAAYENLNKVLELHYRHLEPYIPTIYPLTTQSFKDDDDEVAMQAVEFWSVLAEIEWDLKDQEESEGITSGGESECKRFMDRCATDLTPLVLELLVLQSDDQDNDDNEWNKCMAATVCLMNIVKVCKDQVFDIVKNFIFANVGKRNAPEDWHAREAALTAFGCLVEGPARSKLLPLVNEAFVFLLSHGLSDQHPMVRRTTLWTLGRIFEYLHIPGPYPELVTEHNINDIVEALIQALQVDNAMAVKACYALQQLANGFSDKDEKHVLSPYFARIVEELLRVAYIEVPLDTAALHVTAFEAMHTVIQNSAQESIELVSQMVPHLLARINETFAMNVDSSQMPETTVKVVSQRRNELQGQLCATLQVAIKRACAHPAAKQRLLTQHADSIMEALLKIQASRVAVNDEVVMTMSVLCLEQGPDFHRYLQHSMPHILAGLAKHEDLQVCRVCINAMGDIAREVTTHIAPYADEVMMQLLANLQSENLNRDVKPDILQVFGDMAQGLGVQFDRYVQQVVETLQAAMNIAYTNQLSYKDVDTPDESIIVYNNELRGAIVQAAEGIFSSIPEDPSQIPPMASQLLTPFGRTLLRFVNLIHEDDEYAEDSLLKSCLGLVGDLCGIPGMAAEMQQDANKTWLTQFLQNNRDVDSRVVGYTEGRLRTAGVVTI